jgi:RNA polymerase-binding transcription factor DksA
MNNPSMPPSFQSARRPPVGRWEWHYRRLQSLREGLEGVHGSHREEIAQPLESHSMDAADSGTDEYDHDMALSLLSHEENAIREIDAALDRIAQGKYGICEETGVPIPDGRLRAIPWTRYTREVEERLERQNFADGIRLKPENSVRGDAAGALAEAEDPELEYLQEGQVRRHQRQEDVEAIEQGDGQAPNEAIRNAEGGGM